MDDPRSLAWTGGEAYDPRIWSISCHAAPFTMNDGSDTEMPDTTTIPSLAMADDAADGMPAAPSEHADA